MTDGRVPSGSTAPPQLIERIGDADDVGQVTVIYSFPYSHAVDFFAVEVNGLEKDAETGAWTVPCYTKAGASSSMDHTYDPHEAEVYVRGGVKWDGCVNYEVGDQEHVMMHACGRAHLEKLSRVLVTIFERCGELMQARGVNILEGEFKCRP